MATFSATKNFETLRDTTFPVYDAWSRLPTVDRPAWNTPGKDYRATRKRYTVLEGSSGSSKTISIVQYLVRHHLLQRRVKCDCFRHDQSTCNDSVIEDFRFVMGPDQFGLWDQDCWNEQRKEYRFKNGSLMRFRGCQKPGKLHGPRRDIAWINEVMEVSYDSFRQINARTNDFIIMDFNPSLSVHWVFDRILKQGDRVDCFHSTFRDNPFISPEARADIMSWEPTPENLRAGTADKWSWEVYGLGKRARRDGSIFTNWTVLEDEQWPTALHNVQRDGQFIDFGFSQDPTAVGRVFMLQDRLYLRQIVYETGLITTINQSNPGKPSLELRLREAIECGLFNPRLETVGDCAAAEALADLETSGFRVSKSDKAGGIQYGINLLKQFQMFVHRDSTDFQQELESYAWKKTPDGRFSDDPEDRFNHLLDGLRYWAVSNLKPRTLNSGWRPKAGRVVKKLRRY